MKHKHYNEIVAFANGYDVEFRRMDRMDNGWNSTSCLGFYLDENHEYRVKKIKPKYKVLIKDNCTGNIEISDGYYSVYDVATSCLNILQILESLPEPVHEPVPHKYKEFMIAFAEGEVVQYNIDGKWVDIPEFSKFHTNVVFRIKPKEPKYKVLFICYGGVTISKDYYVTLEEFNKTTGFVGLQLLESLKEE